MKGQLIVAFQKLIDMVAKCLYQESVGMTPLSADGLLEATHSGTQLFSFCSALAGHINGTFSYDTVCCRPMTLSDKLNCIGNCGSVEFTFKRDTS